MSISVADVLREFPGSRVEPPPMREYQRVACRRLVDAQDAGAKRVMIVSCCGSGKSRMLAEIARYRMDEGRKVGWFAHRVELLDQAREELAALGVFPEVLSIQSKIRPDLDYLIQDEVHHFASEEWRKIFEQYPNAPVASGTATPCRADGIGLHNIVDRMVIAARPQEMIDAGFLVPLDILRPAKPTEPGKLSARPVDAYRDHAMGRTALVYSSNLKAAAEHAAEFIAEGIEARVISGETPKEERAKTIADLRSGALKVCVSVAVLTEGTNLKPVSCIILARHIGSLSLYDQITMRGMRTDEGKVNCLLLDLTGTSWSHGHPADERVYSLEGRGVRKGCDDWVDPQTSCRVCGAPTVPGEACLDCGAEPKKMEAPKVVPSPLVKYAAMRALDPSKQAAWLAKQVAVMRAKGYRRGWLFYRFKTVFGFPPSAELLRQAGA